MPKEIEMSKAIAAKMPDFADVVRRASKGKATAEEIHRILDEMPEIERQIGSVAKQAEWAWVKTYSGDNELLAEAARRRMEAAKQTLMGENPTPLERSLARRIVLCQFQLDYVESLFAAKTREGMSAGAVAMYQQWLDRAHGRYLTAVKMLALVRKLAIPPVQVNVAEKQVNVAQMDVTQHVQTSAHRDETLEICP